MAEHGLSERHARALLRLDAADVVPVLQKVIARQLNVSQTEKLVADFLAQKNPAKRTTKRLFSDVRIFLNTINNAFDTMKSAGIDAKLQRTENDTDYIYEIRIPKKAAQRTSG